MDAAKNRGNYWKKIKFSDKDKLFVLGDVVDCGPEPMKVLQDMMMRSNVYPILGNHDYVSRIKQYPEKTDFCD